jgi:hypothetical protein
VGDFTNIGSVQDISQAFCELLHYSLTAFYCQMNYWYLRSAAHSVYCPGYGLDDQGSVQCRGRDFFLRQLVQTGAG